MSQTSFTFTKGNSGEIADWLRQCNIPFHMPSASEIVLDDSYLQEKTDTGNSMSQELSVMGCEINCATTGTLFPLPPQVGERNLMCFASWQTISTLQRQEGAEAPIAPVNRRLFSLPVAPLGQSFMLPCMLPPPTLSSIPTRAGIDALARHSGFRAPTALMSPPSSPILSSSPIPSSPLTSPRSNIATGMTEFSLPSLR